jgi:hypothetical protein
MRDHCIEHRAQILFILLYHSLRCSLGKKVLSNFRQISGNFVVILEKNRNFYFMWFIIKKLILFFKIIKFKEKQFVLSCFKFNLSFI